MQELRNLVSATCSAATCSSSATESVGASFKHVPACRSATQLACVIALLDLRSAGAGRQPVRAHGRGRRSGALHQPRGITQPPAATAWISEPNAYRARCSSAGGASVLQISPLVGAQTATPSPDPTWGLHLLDANIALGNLVSAVQREAGAYAARPSAPLAPAWRG